MDNCIGVGRNAIEHSSGAPRFAGRVNGHVNHDGRADDVVARNAADEAAVQRIAAIVAHYEIAVRRNFERKNVGLAGKIATEKIWLAALRRPDCVVFAQARTIDVNSAVVNVHGFAGQSNDALDDVRSIAGNDGTENNNLLPLGFAPEWSMKVGKRDAGVVAESAHKKVIADEQRVLHRSRRNNARLADRAVDQHQNEDDPEPGDGLAGYFLLGGEILFGFFLFVWLGWLSFHASP